MYTIILPNEDLRDRLQEFLSKNKIQSKIYYGAIHLKTIYKKEYAYKEGDLPKTEELSEKVLTIPLYPSMKKEDLDFMIEKIKEFFK